MGFDFRVNQPQQSVDIYDDRVMVATFSWGALDGTPYIRLVQETKTFWRRSDGTVEAVLKGAGGPDGATLLGEDTVNRCTAIAPFTGEYGLRDEENPLSRIVTISVGKKRVLAVDVLPSAITVGDLEDSFDLVAV